MDDAETLFQTGRRAWDDNDLATAEPALRRALAAAPDNPAIRTALGAVLLKSGRLVEGFPLFDAWREMPDRQGRVAPRLPFTPWRGEPVAGKRLLVWSEDGFGDQIMHARFVRLLADGGTKVTWLCPPELAPLFAASLGVDARRSDESVDLTCDYYCPSGMLPLGFAMTPQTVPGKPWLDVPPPRDLGARIGVMHAGNVQNAPGRPRVLDVEQAQRLLALPGAVDLAPAVTGAKDFLDTAAIIAGLDLVISVDTAVAHLAGAMGKPVWVLLPYVADWRWMAGGETTPWYPTARLFRQGPDRAWAPVVDAVGRQVRAA